MVTKQIKAMAKKEVVDLMKLPPAIRSNLENMDAEIKTAKKSIGVLKKLGMDVRTLEDKLNWAEEVRSTLITEFG